MERQAAGCWEGIVESAGGVILAAEWAARCWWWAVVVVAGSDGCGSVILLKMVIVERVALFVVGQGGWCGVGAMCEGVMVSEKWPCQSLVGSEVRVWMVAAWTEGRRRRCRCAVVGCGWVAAH